jgi:predicted ribosomally synthesized peptide with nif11-like leader
MSKMKQMAALYEKVSTDLDLQKKLLEIMQESKEVGPEETRERLIRFTHDAGFDVDFTEMQQFLKDTLEKNEGQLSEAELDMVAGGKGGGAGTAFVGGFVSAITIITNIDIEVKARS